MIRGDVLLDDKPELDGLLVPEWEHWVFAAPYNERVVDKRRATWDQFLPYLGIV